jgi:hypothetical protein
MKEEILDDNRGGNRDDIPHNSEKERDGDICNKRESEGNLDFNVKSFGLN